MPIDQALLSLLTEMSGKLGGVAATVNDIQTNMVRTETCKAHMDSVRDGVARALGMAEEAGDDAQEAKELARKRQTAGNYPAVSAAGSGGPTVAVNGGGAHTMVSVKTGSGEDDATKKPSWWVRFGDLARLISALVAITGAVTAIWHFTSRIEAAVGAQRFQILTVPMPALPLPPHSDAGPSIPKTRHP